MKIGIYSIGVILGVFLGALIISISSIYVPIQIRDTQGTVTAIKKSDKSGYVATVKVPTHHMGYISHVDICTDSCYKVGDVIKFK